jgi:hypothetical protein
VNTLVVPDPADAIDASANGNDPRLEALQSAGDAAISATVAELAPLIDGILAHACRTDGVLRESLDDLRAEVVTRIVHKLRETCGGGEAVIRLEDYVATLTRNCVHDVLRARHPERTRLMYRIRFLMANDVRFAMWSVDGSTRCGLAEWRGSVATADAVLPSMDVPHVVFDGTRTADALLALFQILGGPLELDILVTSLMDLWNIAEETTVDIESVPVPDERPTQLASLETRAFFEALWSEVGALRPLQRAALLLNLRDRERGNALTLFVLLGIADIDAIATAIGLPVDDLATLWCDLPLDDATIAERFAITRQQVINLRKSARERLRRRLRI